MSDDREENINELKARLEREVHVSFDKMVEDFTVATRSISDGYCKEGDMAMESLQYPSDMLRVAAVKSSTNLSNSTCT